MIEECKSSELNHNKNNELISEIGEKLRKAASNMEKRKKSKSMIADQD